MSNEKTIQNALHNWRLKMNHPFISPNATLPSGEADLLSVTKAGFVYEHEIKISRADFKNDFKHKEEKHVWMRDAKKLKGECLRHVFSNQRWLRNTKAVPLHCPNYFIYVCPKDLIAVKEVPEYAGLAFWLPNTQGFEHLWRFGRIQVVKEPPRLHSEKITKNRMEKLAISMMYRYWNYRLKDSAVL